MISNKTEKGFNLKNIILIFLPVFISIILQYLVNIIDVIILFLANMASDDKTVRSRSIETIMNQSYNQPMNIAYMTLATHLVACVIFGVWYLKSNNITPSLSAAKASLKKLFITPVFLVIAGYAGQLMVDGVLNICRTHFEELFTEYDKMVSNVTGAQASFVMLFAVFIVAPIGEELLFRGVVLHYSKKCLPAYGAIGFSSLLFGLYHGNVIQGIYATILGFVLGLLAYKCDSIVPGILLHMAINISIILVPSVLLSTTITSVITAVVALIVFVIGIILTLKFYKHDIPVTEKSDK